jgi:hypothetical protein
MDRPPREKPWQSWTWVVLWTLIIFISIPLARKIQAVVAGRWGRDAFAWFTVSCILLATLGAVRYALRHRRRIGGAGLAWLAACSAGYLYYAYVLRAVPEETLHFLQYGMLGYLVFRALSHNIRDVAIYFNAAAACALIGALDEVIQWITPQRYFDWRDVKLNAVSGALMQVALALGFRPAFIAGPIAPGSIRLLCKLLAALALLLGFCLSNTPPRVEQYARRFEPLRFLSQNDSMTEYGYLHRDPEIGRFYSRLTQARLAAENEQRGEQVADLLDQFPDSRYSDFLDVWTAGVDPFAHEARVHIYRRDRHLDRAWEVHHDPAAFRANLTVAWREQRILEKYFGRALAHSRFRLSPGRRELLQEQNLPAVPYTSPVSSQIIVGIREWQIWGGIGGLLVLLGLWHWRQGRPAPARPEPPYPPIPIPHE